MNTNEIQEFTKIFIEDHRTVKNFFGIYTSFKSEEISKKQVLNLFKRLTPKTFHDCMKVTIHPFGFEVLNGPMPFKIYIADENSDILDLRCEFKSLQSPVYWITRDREKLLPSEMKTSHLFYIIKMIWNHSAPENLKFKPYTRYVFDCKIYTDEYIKKIFPVLLHECVGRKDLPNEMILVLNKMYKMANTVHLKLIEG